MKHKYAPEKSWNFLRSDCTVERAGKIGEEMVDYAADRLHNMGQFIAHPFKKEKRDIRPTKHHWE